MKTLNIHYIDRIGQRLQSRKPERTWLQAFVPPVTRGRMEILGKINEVTYIDDALASGINATYYSMNRLQGNIIWILCNDDPSTPLEELNEVMVYKTRHIVTCGALAPIAEMLYGNRIPVSTVPDPESAIRWAGRLSRPGDRVLFSPATRKIPGMTPEQASKLFRKNFQKTLTSER